MSLETKNLEEFERPKEKAWKFLLENFFKMVKL
jgi:hypothetical protein